MTVMEFISKYGITLFLGGLIPLFWFILNSTFAKKSELEVEKKRITSLEKDVTNLPSYKNFSQLQSTIAKLDGDIKAINKSLVHVSKSVDLLVQNELKKRE